MTSTKPQNPPKRHHFVPKFLLQNWARPDGKIIAYRKLANGKVVGDRVAAKGAGYEDHLYTFPKLGDQATVVETKLLAPLDDSAGKLVAKMIATGGEELEHKEMVWWSHFLLSMVLRNPESVKSLKQAAMAIWESSGPKTQEQYEKHKGPNDPATLEEWIANEDSTGGEALGVKLLNSLTLNNVIAERIRTMHWNVLTFADTPQKLITSDRAVFTSNGLAKENGQILLPLGPDHLFCAFHDEGFLAHLKSEDPGYLHDMARKLLAVRARRYIYSNSAKETEFVGQWMGYEQVPTLGESLAKKWLVDPDLAKLPD